MSQKHTHSHTHMRLRLFMSGGVRLCHFSAHRKRSQFTGGTMSHRRMTAGCAAPVRRSALNHRFPAGSPLKCRFLASVLDLITLIRGSYSLACWYAARAADSSGGMGHRTWREAASPGSVIGGEKYGFVSLSRRFFQLKKLKIWLCK